MALAARQRKHRINLGSPWLRAANRSLAGFGCLRIAARMPIIFVLAVRNRSEPAQVNCMDVGAASYSRISCAPIKLAEYLVCGIPAKVNGGIRDAAEIVGREKVGVGFPNFSGFGGAHGDYLFATLDDANLAVRCRTAPPTCSINRKVAAYDATYRRLPARSNSPGAKSAHSQPLMVTTGKYS